MPPKKASRSAPTSIAKKAKRDCHYDDSWTARFQGICRSQEGPTYARCTLCKSDFNDIHDKSIVGGAYGRGLSRIFVLESWHL